MFVSCDDKIAPEVTAREINVGEHPIPGGERGFWLVVKCAEMQGFEVGSQKMEDGNRWTRISGWESISLNRFKLKI